MTKGAMFGDLVSILINTTIDPPLGVCFNCWQDGHARRACPRPKVARYCLNCGRRGVDLYSCSRCGPAHARYVLEKYRTRVDSPGEVVARREVPSQREEPPRRTRSPSNAEIASTPVPPPIEEEPHPVTPATTRGSPQICGSLEPERKPTVEELEAATCLTESLQKVDEATRRTILAALYRRKED